MKFSITLPVALSTMILACGNADHGEEMQAYEQDRSMMMAGDMGSLESRVAQATGQATGQAMPAPDQGPGGMRTHTVQSIQYRMPMAQLEFPADWNFEQDQRTGNWSITAPGLKVVNSGNAMFMYDQDPYFAQLAQQAGQKMRGPVTAEQVVQQDLIPMMQREGRRFVRQENAPAVAAADQRGLDPLVSFGPTRKSTQANASEWDNKDGSKTLVVLHQFAFQGQTSGNWGYYMTILETSADRFPQAKQALLNGLGSTRYNPQYFAAYNASEQQKSQQSWSAHNARMQANQANFDAQQRNFRANADATNDAIMGVYRSQSAASDRGQDQFVNYIRDEQNAVNPNTGEAMKVESGYNQYWMNQNNEYYGTDDVLTDPNIGNTTNDVWQSVEVEP
ncbi:MAG: hypothetical protein KDB84_03650 [Flavobacteriales bacterium]|nr:hypothetical protein [Flavobacteriales bacterium]